jgi:alpha-amylase
VTAFVRDHGPSVIAITQRGATDRSTQLAHLPLLSKARNGAKPFGTIYRRVNTMSVALITWGRFVDSKGNKVTVPAPTTDPGSPWLWDYIVSIAPELAKVGFTALQLPPVSKVQGGAGEGCDGYGVYDPRDIGNKNQQGSVPTRYGSAESLRRLVAVSHASGMDVFLDIVLHQLIGGNGGSYRYLGADGKTLNGRGAMTPSCFRGQPPRRPEDDVPVPSDDFEFGDEKVYQNCQPSGYTIDDALDYGDWLFRTTGADGARFDDTKGTWAPFVHQFMTSNAMASKSFLSEYFDGVPANLNWWATSSPMNGRSGVEDFTLHWRLQAACNGYQANQLTAGDMGYWRWRSDLAYGFVDNPDTDTSPGQQVMFNKLLGYAFMFTVPMHMALVYGKDYFPSSVWPGAYGLKKGIDNLIWINRMFAFGKCAVRWVDDKVIAIDRDGDGGPSGWSGGLLTCLNFDTWNWRNITVQTTFGANRHLQDYTGHHADVWTDGNGRATINIPPNAYSSGESYCCFAPAGVNQPLKMTSRHTSQTFFGAPDLDIGPATNVAHTIGRIYCAEGSSITASLNANRAGWQEDSNVRLNVVAPSATELVSCTLPATGGGVQGESITTEKGWHSLVVVGAKMPAAGAPFTATVLYLGA